MDCETTCDSTPHKSGFTNVKKSQKGDNITMGQGSGTEVKTTGDIAGNKINVNGVDEGPTTFKDVIYVSTANFDLFSLSKRMRPG